QGAGARRRRVLELLGEADDPLAGLGPHVGVAVERARDRADGDAAQAGQLADRGAFGRHGFVVAVALSPKTFLAIAGILTTPVRAVSRAGCAHRGQDMFAEGAG